LRSGDSGRKTPDVDRCPSETASESCKGECDPSEGEREPSDEECDPSEGERDLSEGELIPNDEMRVRYDAYFSSNNVFTGFFVPSGENTWNWACGSDL